jgi:hypothetical protein
MQRWGVRGVLLGALVTLGLAAAVAWTQAPAKPKLERLKIAVAPLGWDTHYS